MSTLYRDAWLESRPVTKTDLLRKCFTLAGGTFECGFPDYCVGVKQAGLPGLINNVFGDFGYTEVTFEFWYKPQASGFSTIIFGDFNLRNYVYHDVNNDLNVLLTNTDLLPINIIVPNAFNYGEWNHVAIVYDAITDDQLKVYVNGVLGASDNLTHNKAIKTSVQPFSILTDPITNQTTVFSSISDFRIWNEIRSVDKIEACRWSQRNPDNEPALLAYWPLNQGTGISAVELVDGNFNLTLGSGVEWKTDKFADRFGASFVCGQYTIVGDRKVSLVYPVATPEDCDHALVVRWTDSNDIVQRRYLYTVEGVDMYATVTAYAGERLPETFYIEVWNIDGNPTATLPETVIYVSATSVPTTGADRTSTEYVDDPVVDTTIAEPFPLTFPLTFGAQQTYP
jgi:hypothetical protein